jgi:hypothetical protein
MKFLEKTIKAKKKKWKIEKKIPGWLSVKANALRSLLAEKNFKSFSIIGELPTRSLHNALPRNAYKGLFLVNRLSITLANSDFICPPQTKSVILSYWKFYLMFFDCL